MNNFLKSTLTFLLLSTALWVHAQQGPTLPCPDCEQVYTKPIPYEGSWYNPEQSGSGFLIDVQNDLLLGYYFGYDVEGKPDWAIFSGQLQDGSEQNALWKVNATLARFNGGACLNCEYTAPTEDASLGEIEIVFNRMAHASYSVDGGAVQNIVPIYFGYSLLDFSEQQPAYHTPELQGWWTVFVDQSIENNDIPPQYAYTNFMVHISKGEIIRNGDLSYATFYYPNSPEITFIGFIDCSNQIEEGTMQAKCIYQPDFNPSGFEIDLANISPNRIYGEATNGDTIEMISTSSDFCITSNQPEDCINTGVFDYLDGDLNQRSAFNFYLN